MNLRPRRARPSYSSLLDFEGGDAAAGESGPDPEGSGSSGDDFRPPKDDEDDVDIDTAISPEETDDSPAEYPSGDDGGAQVFLNLDEEIPVHGRGKSKLQVGPSVLARRETVTLAPGLSRPVNRQNYALPTPSSDHRHRSGPLYRHTRRVERLTSAPVQFCPGETTATKNWSHDPIVTDRVNKSSGYSVGWGPAWELMEDRSWWKEAAYKTEEEKEKHRRPRVHESVEVDCNLKVLDEMSAASFSPCDSTVKNGGPPKPAQGLDCYFGPLGHQTKKHMKTFDTIDISESVSEKRAHVFQAGASVWGLDWCPIHVEDRPHRDYKQYLAVAPLPSRTYSPRIGVKCQRPSRACIQIWTIAPSDKPMAKLSGKMQCELVVCIDVGPAYDIKWCPLPANDPWSRASSFTPRKLGILAGTFEDGSLSLFAIPDPLDIVATHNVTEPAYVKLSEPLLRIELEETACWSLDWANSEIIAVGCTNGSIAVYDVKKAMHSESTGYDILPIYYFTVHQAAIRALQWVRAPPVSADGFPQLSNNPYIIVSGGYDGCEMITDLREGNGNIMNRTRDVVSSMTYSTHAIGPISIDHENIVKIFNVTPSMLGRGHTLLEPAGPVWSIHASDYHSQVAVGAADGSCLTTNTLRSTRRSGAVPFFGYKIYQVDYSRQTGEYRMLDQFLPQETQDRPAATRAMRRAKPENEGSTIINPAGTGAWSPQVAVQRVVWNTGGGLGNAPLLASATGSGLCRVDWLVGRLIHNKSPYGGISGIRREKDGDGAVDNDINDTD